MTPKFNRETYGYNTQQVDEYIDKLHHDSQELSRVNDELLLLYLSELRQLTHMGIKLPEKSTERNSLSMDRINNLIEQAYSQRDQQVYIPPKIQMAEPPPRKKRAGRGGGIFTGILLFVSALVFGLVVSFFGLGESTEPPRDIMGFSAMTVLTRSMQDEIPQDSLIITRRVENPHTILIGDVITYLTPHNTTITHQVVDIIPNYEGTGMPGFQTQGIMNSQPDPDIVPAMNVVGLVIFHNLFLGNVVIFIRSYAMFIGIFIVMTVVLISVARRLIFRGEPEEPMRGR